MKRRDLLKGAAALPFIAETMFGNTARRPKLIKPKRLFPGDKVGIIAPASGVTPETWERAVKNIESLGFKPEVGKFARGIKSFLSGTDKERLHDLHWAFGDTSVKAVWCVRGGGGAPRLLPDIDFELIRRNPKIFIGFSDITALHVAIYQTCGLVTFHGPVASSSYSDYTKMHVMNVLTNPAASYKMDVSPVNAASPSPRFRSESLVNGKCRGRLIGGNLSLLAAVAGTKYALGDLKGKILFIEDIGEPPYRIDRMMTQLRQSTNLGELAGIILGVFDDSGSAAANTAQPVIDVFRDRLGNLKVPMAYGLSFGHIRDNMTIPYGVEAEFDAGQLTLTLLEAAVS